jgi:hypothetical protein
LKKVANLQNDGNYLQLSYKSISRRASFSSFQPPLSIDQSLLCPLYFPHIKLSLSFSMSVPLGFLRCSIKFLLSSTDSSFFLPYLAIRGITDLSYQLSRISGSWDSLSVYRTLSRNRTRMKMSLDVEVRNHGERPLIEGLHWNACRRCRWYFDSTRRRSLVSDRRARMDQKQRLRTSAAQSTMSFVLRHSDNSPRVRQSEARISDSHILPYPFSRPSHSMVRPHLFLFPFPY